jgi:hypothetical protein
VPRSWSSLVSLLVALALSVGGLPGIAAARVATSAAPADDVDPQTKQLKALYDDAHVAFLAGRYREAAQKFDTGYKSSSLGAFLFNAAVAWENAGELSMAIDRYAEYLVRNPDAGDSVEVQGRLAALKDAVENQKDVEIGAARTKGVAIITSKPEGAEIRLDTPDAPVFATTPFRGTLPSGEHTLHIRARGFKPEAKDFPDNREKMIVAHFSLSEEYFLGHLEVRSPIAGAKIYLRQLKDSDGKEVSQDDQSDASVGATPFSNQVPPGLYKLRVAKEGFKDYEAEVEVAQGKVKTVSAELEPVEFILVNVKHKDPESKEAELYEEGEAKRLCFIPCETKLPPGKHKLVVKKKGMKPLRFSVSGDKAEAVDVTVDLEPATRRYPAIITGLLMAGTAGTGIAFGIMSARARNDIEADIKNNVQLDKSDPRAQTSKRDAIIADAMFGATALLGALTIYYLVRKTGKPSTGDKQQRALTVVPAASPTGAGLVGEVRF